MTTTWKSENGDWVMTSSETPICFSCTILQNIDKVVEGEFRMKYRDSYKMSAECPICSKVMWKEVG